MIGKPVEEILGRTAEELFNKKDAQQIRQLDNLNFKGKNVDEAKLISSSGNKWYRTIQTPIKEDGHIIGVTGIVIEVTHEKENEEALKKSKEKYRSFIQNHRGISYKSYLDKPPILFDGNVQEITGYSKKDFLQGKIKWVDLILKEDLKKIKGSWVRLTKPPEISLEREYRIKKKNGEIIWIRDLVKNLKNKDKKVKYVQGELYDITEKKKIEEDLRFYKTFLNSVPGFAFAKDSNLKYVSANHSFCDLLNIPYDKIKGKTDYDIFPKNLAKKYIKDDKIVLKTKKSLLVEEITYNAKTKKRFIVATRKYPWFDKNGKVIGVYGIGFDITKISQAQEKLKKSEEKYRSIIDNTSDFIQIISKEGDIKFVNSAWIKTFKYSKRAALKLNILKDLVVPHNISHCKEILNKALKGECLKNIEAIFKTKKGEEIYIEGNIVPRLVNNKINSFNCLWRDVSKKKKKEKRIIKEKEKIENYLNLAGNLIIVLDKDMKISMINKKGAEILGYADNKEDLIGKNWVKYFIPKLLKEEVKKVFDKVLKGELKMLEHYENPLIDKFGEQRVISWYNSLIKDELGNIIGVLSSGEDITDKKKIEQLRTTALRDVSHELKTPISKMRMIIDLLNEELEKTNANKQKMKEYVNAIIRNSNISLREIQSILDFSKLQTINKVKKKKINICQLTEESTNYFNKIAKEKGLKIDHITESKIPKIHGNNKLIKTMIENLLKNAIKFTDKGKIGVICKKEKQEIIIKVEDSGRGMKQKDILKIFKPYVQLDPSAVGTGVGLAMCKKIIELHGGTINVKSRLGKGSKFIVKIPINQNETH